MNLDPFNRDRTYFHLGYGSRAGIPAGDVAQVEQAMDQLSGNYAANRIIQILDQCDNLYQEWIDYKVDDHVTKELMSGDINRSTIRTLPPGPSRKIAWENYMVMVRELAQNLWVPCYREETNLRFRFERGAGDYLDIVPGVADTAIGASQYVTMRSVGFGLPIF